MPLNIIVIGAGIAGLTAAAALCKDGHTVQVSEHYPILHIAAIATLSRVSGLI
jgi:phytoene dehydrogenase-like protein